MTSQETAGTLIFKGNKSKRRVLAALAALVAGAAILMALFSSTVPVTWKLAVDPDGDGRSDIESVAVRNGTVYFTNTGSCDEKENTTYEELCVYAVDAHTGQERWKMEKKVFRDTEIAVADELLYFGAQVGGTPDDYLFAVDTDTGELKWQLDPKHGDELAYPITADGVVYFGTNLNVDDERGKGYLHAIDGKTAQRLWKIEAGWRIVSYVEAEGVVYYVSTRQIGDDLLNHLQVHAVDSKSGQEKWRATAPASILDRPVVADGLVYLPTATGLNALDSETGDEKWRYQTHRGRISAPAIAGGILVFSMCERPSGIQPPYAGACYLIAIDKQTREQKWTFGPRIGMSVYDAPITYDGEIYSASFFGAIYAVDAQTGKEEWQFRTTGRIYAPPVLFDGVIYIGGSKGLYAIPITRSYAPSSTP